MMGIAALIALLLSSIFNIYEMVSSNKIIKERWYELLDRNTKINVTSRLKLFWKKNIILTALMIGVFLILISTFVGSGSRYRNVISMAALVFSAASAVIIAAGRKKFNQEIKEYIR